ncbi:MAG: MJ1477/TM1410 family putative glycoside hydrolase [Thermodesulfobacteriota bacterium]|nr:MJ1477/TM1410 family putative glycoside hydrolase [Thermodesulfobacteriota bacterium]
MCWLYQLQKAEPNEIIKSGFKIAVMDYSRDGTEKNKYSIPEIGKMKAASIIPICYLSIGEAEEYRYYWRPEWKKTPKWLGKENPDWEENYKVKYWHPEWQAIIFSYLDKIIEQGFSGVYLDIVDGFEYWSDEENPDNCFSEKEAAEKMITFIKNLSIYARKKAGNDFKVFPQNGERLLDYDHDGSYLETISGYGVEDVWYDGITPQLKNEIAERIAYLKKLIKHNKVVLAVEYVDDGSGYKGNNKKRIDKVVANCKKFSFHYYIAKVDTELDSINRIHNIQPYT